MSPSACPGRDVLLQFASDALPDGAPLELTEHLASCQDCRRLLETLDDAQMSTAVSPAMHDRSWSAPVPPLVDGLNRVEPTMAAEQHLPSRSTARQPQRSDHAQLPERYELLSAVASGGMGAVIRVRDRNLDRELALKMLLPRIAGQPELVSRFQREAAITGSLQHPGIPPVVELGTLGDGSPFFSMKLVEGETLEAQLEQRTSPEDRQSHFLSIFLQVAQTLAYAHSRRIIHRDLKPFNIMVGKFGEVQVMDWGLAKSLDATEELAGEPGNLEQSFDADETSAGQILGTLYYMPPEQARGEITQVDERSDVFGLGAILCQILTGQPPYVGRERRALLKLAIAADTAPVIARLTSHQVDAELIELVTSCLAADPADRPPNAGVVATAIEHQLSSAEARARRAELKVAEERARAEAERRRRRAQVSLFASVGLTILAALGGVAWWIATDRLQTRVRNEQLAGMLTEAEQFYGQVADDPIAHTATWLQAQDRLAGAVAVAGSGKVDERLENQTQNLQARMQAAERDRELVKRMDEIYVLPTTDFDGALEWWRYSDTLTSYRVAFATYGIDANLTDVAAAATAIQARPAKVQREIIASLGNWLQLAALEGDDSVEWLVGVLVETDDDPWRLELWPAIASQDGSKVSSLSRSADVVDQHPRLVSGLARDLLWQYRGRADAARALLLRYVRTNSKDYWINLLLGKSYILQGDKNAAEAMRYFTAALALRDDPAAYDGLAYALSLLGRHEETLECAQRSLASNPRNAYAYSIASSAHLTLGEIESAIEAATESLRIRPDVTYRYAVLARAIRSKAEDQSDWIAAYRRQLPAEASTIHAELGLAQALRELGQQAEGLQVLERLVESEPQIAKPYLTLGSLYRGQNLSRAIEMYERAAEVEPTADNLNLLGSLYSSEDHKRALECFRTALQLDPKSASASLSIVNLLHGQGRLDEAMDFLKDQAEIDFGKAWVPEWQALISAKQGDDEAAIRFAEQAIQRDPQRSRPYRLAAEAYARSGRFKQVSATYRRLIEVEGRIESDAAFQASQTILGSGSDLSAADRELVLSLMQAALRSWKNKYPVIEVGSSRPDVWLVHPSLRRVREATELARLPESEQVAWRTFWTNVTAEVVTVAMGLQGRIDPEVTTGMVRAAATYQPTAHHLDHLGWHLIQQEKWNEAIQVLRRAIEIDEEHTQARANLTIALRALGQSEEALVHVTRVAENRGDLWSLNLRCQILFELSDYERCRSAARQALKVDDVNPSTWNYLAISNRQLGRWEESAVAFEVLLDKYANHPEWDRWVAIIALANAGTQQFQDHPVPDASEQHDSDAVDVTQQDRFRWRKRSLYQLTILADAANQQPRLHSSLNDPDLACVREDSQLAKLPAAERPAWEKLWAKIRSESIP